MAEKKNEETRKSLISPVKKRLLTRIFSSFLSLVGVTIIIFALCRILPGDPARAALGPQATEEMVQEFREKFHLNDPITVQFYFWLKDLSKGKMGYSIISEEDTWITIKRFFPASIELAIIGSTLMVVISIVVGGIAGRYNGSWIDHLTRMIAYIGVSIPSFVFAILAIFFFGYVTGWFPIMGRMNLLISRPPTVTGLLTVDSLIAGDIKAFSSALHHLILPSLSASIGGISQEIRIIRAAVSENYKKDFVTLESSQGLPDRRILFKYIMPLSLIAAIPALCIDVVYILVRQYVIEIIFAWPGMAQFAMQAILRKDLNAIIGTTIIMGITFFVFNLIADLLVFRLDPRMRLSAVAE